MKSDCPICQAIFSFCAEGCPGSQAPEHSAQLSLRSTVMLT